MYVIMQCTMFQKITLNFGDNLVKSDPFCKLRHHYKKNYISYTKTCTISTMLQL